MEKEKQKEEFVSMVQITSLLDVFLVLIMINRSSFFFLYLHLLISFSKVFYQILMLVE